jgi:hypothetical protein
MGEVFRNPTMISAVKATTMFATITIISYLEFDTGAQPIVSTGNPGQEDGIKKDAVLDERRGYRKVGLSVSLD